ncbi:hypothetical protein Tco_0144871 [Tanacetum coccineum]
MFYDYNDFTHFLGLRNIGIVLTNWTASSSPEYLGPMVLRRFTLEGSALCCCDSPIAYSWGVVLTTMTRKEASDEDEDKEERKSTMLRTDSSAAASPVRFTELRCPLPTPPPSPFTPLSSPLPQIPSPPLPGSRDPVEDYITTTITFILATTITTTYHTSMHQSIYGSDESTAPSTYILAPRSGTLPSGTLPSGTPPSGTLPSGIPPLLPIPLPTSSPHLLLRSTDCRVDVPEVTLPPTRGFKADYGFGGTLDTESRRDLDREIGYGITDVWEDPDEIAEEIPTTDVAELGQRMTYFVITVRQDTYEIYGRLDDAQSDRSLMTGQLNVLRRDRRYHANNALLVEREARAENGELWAADRRRQTQLLETLTQVRALQTQIVVLQRQRTEDGDRPTQHIDHEHDRFREFQRTRDAAPEDADNS